MGFDLNRYALNCQIADVSTAGQAYCVVPTDGDGKIIEIRTVLHNAITTADATLTTKINGTAVTGGGITVAYSGSAAGDTDSASPTGANTVVAGDAIEIETDGGSSTAAKLDVTILIER